MWIIMTGTHIDQNGQYLKDYSYDLTEGQLALLPRGSYEKIHAPWLSAPEDPRRVKLTELANAFAEADQQLTRSMVEEENIEGALIDARERHKSLAEATEAADADEDAADRLKMNEGNIMALEAELAIAHRASLHADEKIKAIKAEILSVESPPEERAKIEDINDADVSVEDVVSKKSKRRGRKK